jgi:hypothetical protein
MRFSVIGLLLFTIGCGGRTVLTPAPQVGRVGENSVQAVQEGVKMLVRTNAWEGTPAELTQVIPILATVENTSDHPLRVRYSEFALVTNTDNRIAALPPFDIKGSESVPVGTAGAPLAAYPYPYHAFRVAPYLLPYYPGFVVYPGAFAYDPLFYSTYYPAFARIPLPTGDMVQKALPEGVLDNGGRITGFLYFGGLDHPQSVSFTADLVDASTGAHFGRIVIPFDVG